MSIKRFSVVYKFFFTYMALVAVVILVCLPIYSKTLQISRQNIVDENYSLFSSDAQAFEAYINQFYSLHNVLGQNSDYKALRVYQTSNYLKKKSVNILNVQKQFAALVNTNPLFTDAYIVFPRNSLVLTCNQTIYDEEKCFSQFMVYENLLPKDIHNLVSEAAIGKSFFQHSNITIMATNTNLDQPVTLITRVGDSSAVICGIIAQETIRKYFHISSNESFLFYLTDTDKSVLSQKGIDENLPVLPETSIFDMTYNNIFYTFLNVSMDSIHCQAVIAIPNQYFAVSITPIKHLIVLYGLLAVTLGVLTSVFFTFKNYAPIKRIVHTPSFERYGGGQKRKINEFTYIENVLNRYDTDNQVLNTHLRSMQNVLKSNLFIRLLNGNIYLISDLNFCIQNLPQLAGEYRVIFASCDFCGEKTSEVTGIEISYLLLNASFSHHFENQYIISQMDNRSIAVLLEDSEENIRLLPDILKVVGSNLHQLYNTELQAGISAVASGAEQVHIAYEQAKIALNLPRKTGVVSDAFLSFYSQTEEHGIKAVGFNNLQKLYELILAGETGAIDRLLSGIQENLSYRGSGGQQNIREIFFVLRYVIRNVMIDQQLDESKNPILLYNPNRSADILFRELYQCCVHICEMLQEKRASNNQTLKKQIMNYINMNCCDSNLYADSIAQNFHLSEKHVYKLVKEHSGQSLNDYIEQLRVKKAMDLVKSTSIPVASVAEQCGFNSVNTFYRVFKNYYSVSPSSYRKEISDQGDKP